MTSKVKTGEPSTQRDKVRWTVVISSNPLLDAMGEVLGFIEGPWVNEIGELARMMGQHERALRQKRDAPRQAQRLREDMKRFGL